MLMALVNLSPFPSFPSGLVNNLPDEAAAAGETLNSLSGGSILSVIGGYCHPDFTLVIAPAGQGESNSKRPFKLQ